MQRQDQGTASIQRGLGAADLRHARQEREDIAGVLGERGADRAGEGLRQVARLGDVARGVDDGDREHAPGALDHVRIRRRTEQGCEAPGVDSGGHRQQAEIRSQDALQVAAQRQRQVGVERAFVHLVQQHGGDAVEAGIG